MRLRVLAPGKVNLCLVLGPTRVDGRHELFTVFQSLSLADELTLSVREEGADVVRCPGVPGENLVSAALRALRARGWSAPPVEIEIIKRIPVAGGMGGGSADAAAALRLAQALHPGRPEELAEIAAQLGADVPAQLSPGAVLGTGAGDVVEPLPPLAPHAYVIVPGRCPLLTSDVYAEADRVDLPRSGADLAGAEQRLRAALRPGARLPAELVVNDLQAAAVSLAPETARTLLEVRKAGAELAIVSGSGPTVAGILWGEDAGVRAMETCRRLAEYHPDAVVAVPVGPEVALPHRLASPS